MRILATAIAIAPLLLGVLPAGAQPASSDTSAPAAAGSQSSSDHSAYLQKAQEEMQEWGQKLHDVGADAAAKGREGGTAAEHELSVAWTKTKAASRKLGTASADGWDSAKATFETASQHLADTWHKVHPEDK